MNLSPVHRLRWLAAIALEEVTAGTARVAIHIAEQARDGRLVVPTATVAASLDIGYNTVSRSFDALVTLGFLVVETPATQHSGAIYAMARVPSAGQSEPHAGSPAVGGLDHSRVPALGESEAIQGPHPAHPGSPSRPPRVPKHGDQQGEQGERQGEEPLLRLRRSGAQMTRGGQSIAGEWTELVDGRGMEAVLGAMAKLPPKDKWPSRVRAALDLLADLPGLAERKVTADEARAALGLPTGANP